MRRGDESFFPCARMLEGEWMMFKCDEFMRWRDISLDSLLKHAILTLQPKYPNLWRLFGVIPVLVMTNAPCERGFRSMKLIKGAQQESMSTETIDTRLTIVARGPAIGSDEYEALVEKVNIIFWKKKQRVPNRANGAFKSHETRKANNSKKRKESHDKEIAQAKADNAAIEATGTPGGSRPVFNRSGYEALEKPEVLGKWQNDQLVAQCFKEGDGCYSENAWVIGKVKVKEDGDFKWKSIEGHRGNEWNIETDKSFKLRSYGIYWVFVRCVDIADDPTPVVVAQTPENTNKKRKKEMIRKQSSNEDEYKKLPKDADG